MNNSRLRSILVYTSIGFIILIIFISLGTTSGRLSEIGFTDLVSRVKEGDVKQIEVTGNELIITLNNKQRLTTQKSPESTVLPGWFTDSIQAVSQHVNMACSPVTRGFRDGSEGADPNR